MSLQRPCLPVCSVSSQCQKEKTSKLTFLTFKKHVNPHGVPDGPKFVVGIFEISRGCLQVVEPPTLFFNQFTAPMIKHKKTFSQHLICYEKPHGVLGNPGIDSDVYECEHRCLKAEQPPTLLFNQFAVPVRSAKFKINGTLQGDYWTTILCDNK
jgi:hypothetical protein